jgi:hypothetical protein
VESDAERGGQGHARVGESAQQAAIDPTLIQIHRAYEKVYGGLWGVGCVGGAGGKASAGGLLDQSKVHNLLLLFFYGFPLRAGGLKLGRKDHIVYLALRAELYTLPYGNATEGLPGKKIK